MKETLQKEYEKSIMDFIIILFLGWFGIHKFLKKEIGIGVLYLFTFGLFGFGWFIDLVKAIIDIYQKHKKKGLQYKDSNLISKENIVDESLDFTSEVENAYNSVLLLYNELNKKNSLERKKEIYEKIISQLTNVDTNKFHKFVLKNSIKEKYGYNTQLGWMSDGCNITEKLLEKYTKELNVNNFRINRLCEFEETIKSIEQHKIVLNKVELKKQKLQDMNEIVISKIGKQFNRDKLVKYVVIDVETTGLKASSDEIIELSAVKYIDYEPVEYFTTLIKPKKAITEEITNINSITNEMVENAPTIEEVLSDFDEFIKGFNIVGYNVPFDLKFLYCNGSNILNQKGIKIYDVCELARKAFKDLYSYSLENVCQDVMNLYRQDAHRSLSDCFATDYVFCLCLDNIIDG